MIVGECSLRGGSVAFLAEACVERGAGCRQRGVCAPPPTLSRAGSEVTLTGAAKKRMLYRSATAFANEDLKIGSTGSP